MFTESYDNVAHSDNRAEHLRIKAQFIDEKRKLKQYKNENTVIGLEIDIKEIVQKECKKIKKWKTREQYEKIRELV